MEKQREAKKRKELKQRKAEKSRETKRNENPNVKAVQSNADSSRVMSILLHVAAALHHHFDHFYLIIEPHLTSPNPHLIII